MIVRFSHDLYNWLNCVDFKFHSNMLIRLLFIAKMPGTAFFETVGMICNVGEMMSRKQTQKYRYKQWGLHTCHHAWRKSHTLWHAHTCTHTHIHTHTRTYTYLHIPTHTPTHIYTINNFVWRQKWDDRNKAIIYSIL